MLAIRSGSGLGDSIYLQAVARHLAGQGRDVLACTNYPDVFIPLKGKVWTAKFRRDRIDRVAHYSSGRYRKETTQFEDCCRQAGVNEPVELKLDWKPLNRRLVDDIRRLGEKVVAVQLPRAPFGDRPDHYGIELLPDCRAMQRAIDALNERGVAVVQVGAGEGRCAFSGLAADYANKTSVRDLLDITFACDAYLGYVSYMVPLAESLRKPALMIWSRAGLTSKDGLIRSITPQKIFHGDQCRAVVDDCSGGELSEAVDALCEQIGSPVAA